MKDIIVLHLCSKNLEDMIYSSCDIECDGLKLVTLGHFLSLYSHKNPKNEKF